MAAVVAQRPFTGADARATHPLTVLVHCADHLEWLTKNRMGNGVYVSLELKQRTTSTLTADDDETELYDRRHSPFATTCVVESSEHLVWNELLVLSLPVDWRHQLDAASWRLSVDIVWRDSRHHEDVLLASVWLPLLQTLSDRSPKHIACEAEVFEPCSESSRPRVYLSIAESAEMDAAEEVMEISIQDSEGCSDGHRCVVLSSQDQVGGISWRELFQVVGKRAVNGDALDPHTNSVWVSPQSKSRELSRDEFKREWHYPMVVYRNAVSSLASLDTFYALLYAGYDSTPVASAKLDFSRIPKTGEPKEVTISLQSSLDTPNTDGRLRTVIRRWDASTWMEFSSNRSRRRIVASNRKIHRNLEMQQLEWTGAICRGLKRYPLSSICDDAGISALLVRYLKATQEATSPHLKNPGSASETTERLQHEHVQQLQRELVMKQEAIRKLEEEVEARDSALQTCGMKLITARTEIKARDEVIIQLRKQLTASVEREAAQTRELTTDFNSTTGIRTDSEAGRRLSLLITKYKELERAHDSSNKELDDAKRSIAALDLLQAKYTELQRAHLVQAELVQKLQQDKLQFNTLQKTVRLQEKVIKKLENTVAGHTIDDTRFSPVVGSTITTESLSCDPASAPSAVRLRILEEQLQINSRAAAIEIAQLKMRIMELETLNAKLAAETPVARSQAS